jgi:hypothetical protein
MVAGEMTEFSSVINSVPGFSGPSGAVFASVSYDTVNIYVQTTPDPGSYFKVITNTPTSWNDFAIVVGYHQ